MHSNKKILAFYIMQIPNNQTEITKINEYEHLPVFF